MKRRIIYRLCLIIALMCSLFGLIVLLYIRLDKQIPDQIHILLGKQEHFDFSLPFEADLEGDDISVINVSHGKIDENEIHFNLDEPFSIQSEAIGTYQIKLKLFGLIDYKTIDVDVIDDMELVPSGEPVGIYIESDGILVLGTSSLVGEDGQVHEPARNVLKSGDYILKVDGKKVHTKQEVIDLIQKNKNKELFFDIRRNNKNLEVSLKPVKTEDKNYKIGVWIRDNTQGVGTLTFISEDGTFGALGHGITDVDTNEIMEISSGILYNATILDIIKGENGSPGEVIGMIRTSKGNDIGNIRKNTHQGIFGKINTKNYKVNAKKALPVGLKQDIKLGKANILCSVEGSVKEYEIEIEKIELNTKNHSKGLVIRIIDENLLSITNGIIQGMSGSPIIQNGKIIGAVTHVFIQDSTKGYGTFIENMIQYSK